MPDLIAWELSLPCQTKSGYTERQLMQTNAPNSFFITPIIAVRT
jgi:hypothetical protein